MYQRRETNYTPSSQTLVYQIPWVKLPSISCRCSNTPCLAIHFINHRIVQEGVELEHSPSSFLSFFCGRLVHSVSSIVVLDVASHGVRKRRGTRGDTFLIFPQRRRRWDDDVLSQGIDQPVGAREHLNTRVKIAVKRKGVTSK